MKTRVTNTPARLRQKRLIKKWTDPVTLTRGKIYQRRDGMFWCELSNNDEDAFTIASTPKEALAEAKKLLADKY